MVNIRFKILISLKLCKKPGFIDSTEGSDYRLVIQLRADSNYTWAPYSSLVLDILTANARSVRKLNYALHNWIFFIVYSLILSCKHKWKHHNIRDSKFTTLTKDDVALWKNEIAMLNLIRCALLCEYSKLGIISHNLHFNPPIFYSAVGVYIIV